MSIPSRTSPLLCKIRERYVLNQAGSSKETFHISLDTGGSHISFRVGDSIGIFPDNDPVIVDALLAMTRFSQDQVVHCRAGHSFSLRDYLLKKANISKCTTALLKLLFEKGATYPLLAQLLLPENKPQAMDFLQTHQLIDILQQFPDSSLSAQELCTTLLPMMPRFYSIASSPKMFPHEIHLTVASLIYETAGGPRHGVGSYFLGHTAKFFETTVPIYVQPSNGFTLPDDPNAAIIMIGPGTGIAPFRAFLQERMALQHTGRNWLFFGERNRATDFYYEPFFTSLEHQQKLRLSLAFSRDRTEKTYVQHRLWEERADIWTWIQQGAYFYVCGDAEKMAKDVEMTLLHIAQDQGLVEEDARLWLKSLRKDRKYLQDVY